jgi:hypothetical protein
MNIEEIKAALASGKQVQEHPGYFIVQSNHTGDLYLQFKNNGYTVGIENADLSICHIED